MLPELPPEEDRPGVPIAPPLLFVVPILASLSARMAGSDQLRAWRVPMDTWAGDPGQFRVDAAGRADRSRACRSHRHHGEERYLERNFGEGYLNYKRRVRRWL